jgi:hypothetical protein
VLPGRYPSLGKVFGMAGAEVSPAGEAGAARKAFDSAGKGLVVFVLAAVALFMFALGVFSWEPVL